MANDSRIVRCEELLDSRTGSPYTAGGTRRYVRKWLVVLQGGHRNLGANVVCAAPGIKPYAPYATEDGKEHDVQALCVDIHLEDPVDRLDGTHRIVVAEYSTEMPQGGPPRFVNFGMTGGGAETFPWMEPPHIEWDSEVVREAPARDLDGKAYLNAAYQPFKPAPTFEEGRSVLIYQRNEQTFSSRNQARYSFAVNADTFLGEVPGSVQLYPPRAVLSWRGPVSYWKVTYRFRFNKPESRLPANAQLQAGPGGMTPVVPGGGVLGGVIDALNVPLRSWQPKILNCGLMKTQSVWSNGPFFRMPVPIFRGAGAVTEPVLLNADGSEMRPDTTTGKWPDPVYMDFRQFLSLPFTPLLVAGIGFPL